MDRNIIIILVSSIILPWCIYVHKARKSLGDATITAGYGLMALWVIMVGLPNIPVLIAPFSPPIHGRVVDATNQPVANCNIKAYWVIEEIGLAGGHTGTYEQFSTKTDAQGNFIIPRRMKVLAVLGFLPALQIVSGYGGMRILAYTHGYPYASEMIGGSLQRLSLSPVRITMNVMCPCTEVLRRKMNDLKLEFYSWNSPYGILTDEDKEYFQEDIRYRYAHFNEIFKGAEPQEIETALISIAGGLDFNDTIQVFERLKREFPEKAQFADREIEKLKMKNHKDIK